MAYDRDIRETPAPGAAGTGMNNPGVDPRAEQILPDTPIFDAAGEDIGVVSDAGFTDGMLSAHQRGIFAHDVTIPLDVIARTDASGVYLTVTKDQLRDRSGGRAGKAGRAATQAEPARKARARPNDMATDSGSPHADLDVPPPDER